MIPGLGNIKVIAIAIAVALLVGLLIMMKLVGLGESRAYNKVRERNEKLQAKRAAVPRTTGADTSDSMRDGSF